MRFRSGRWLVAVVVLVSAMLPAGTGVTAQQATPASSAGGEAVTAALQNAVPLGEAGEVNGVTIVVTGFEPDASHLDPGGSGSVPPDDATVVRIGLTLTNTSGEEVVLNRIGPDLAFAVAGNRGILRNSYYDRCEVENDLRTDETPLGAGETVDRNLCMYMYDEDIPSLQLLAFDRTSDLSTSEQMTNGVWFDLGAAEPFDPSMTAAQAEAARAVAPDGPAGVDSPHSGVTTTGLVVVELLEYVPDATSELTVERDSPYPDPDDGNVYAKATLRFTNVGNTVGSNYRLLVGDSGFGWSQTYTPDGYGSAPGSLIPGGSQTVTHFWTVPANDTKRAIVIADDTGQPAAITWMHADPAAPFSWTAPSVTLASPGSATPDAPSPLGQEFSVGDVNLTVTRDAAADTEFSYRYLVSATYAGNEASGGMWNIVPYSGPAGSEESCTAIYGIFLPGASTGDVSVGCYADGTLNSPLQFRVWGIGQSIDTATTAWVVADGDAPAAAPDDTTGTGEAPAGEAAAEDTPAAADAPVSGDQTATVTAATANVRADATTSSAIVTVLSAGDVVTITGDPVDADGFTWYPIIAPDGTAGWIASQLIALT